MRMLVLISSLAGLLVLLEVAAQTQAPVSQIRPTSGPATAIVITVSGKGAMWADLGPGLAVDILPTGRAMIRTTTTSSHTHVNGHAPTLTWEDPRTCFTLPSGAQHAVVHLNGLRQSSVVDYTEVSPGKLCFIPHYGNLLLTTPDDGTQLVRLDYVTNP